MFDLSLNFTRRVNFLEGHLQYHTRMEHILLPTTIEFLDGDRPHVGKVMITPCHQGYGTTLGNAMRRVLLSSLPGAAVESIKITGASHEFSTIEGVLEDVIEIILNMKQLAVRLHGEGPVTLHLTKKGKGVVTAADFDKDSAVEIMNPDLKIATVTSATTTFEMEVIVNHGRGYVPVSEKSTKQLDLGTIAIDSLYTPIRDVGYDIEMTRVGDVTNYEKLTVSIETNGTITPKEALSQATKILLDHFTLVMRSAENSGPMEDATPAAAAPEADTVMAPVAEEIVSEELDATEDTDKKPKKAKKSKKTE